MRVQIKVLAILTVIAAMVIAATCLSWGAGTVSSQATWREYGRALKLYREGREEDAYAVVLTLSNASLDFGGLVSWETPDVEGLTRLAEAKQSVLRATEQTLGQSVSLARQGKRHEALEGIKAGARIAGALVYAEPPKVEFLFSAKAVLHDVIWCRGRVQLALGNMNGLPAARLEQAALKTTFCKSVVEPLRVWLEERQQPEGVESETDLVKRLRGEFIRQVRTQLTVLPGLEGVNPNRGNIASKDR